jgi:ankyrin repeat protein
VVAACGDTQDCVDVIVRNKEKKSGAGGKRRALEARNNKGDTPLHCAAGAGNAHMISCLVALVTGDDEAGAAAAFLRMQNQCGETALHQAIRAAANNDKFKVDCIQQLMAVDPELACIPHEDGASPLYLAIELGQLWIARHLYVKSKGKLSYSGPDGGNVLHAAVYFGQGKTN